MHFFSKIGLVPLVKRGHFSIKHVIKNLFVYNINQAEEKIRKVEHIQKSRGGGSLSSGRRIVAALEKHIIRVRGKSETSLSLAC